MSNHASTTTFQQAASLAAALVICLVVVLAMFTEPAGKNVPLSFSSGSQARTAACDVVFVFTAENILGLVVIGLISGTFGSMLGMGGGVLKMSFLLLFFGFHTGVSRFAALLSYFVVAVGASYRYRELKVIMMEVVKILIPWSVVGILLGAIVGHYLPRDVMTMLLGMFLLLISVVMARRALSRYPDVLASANGAAQAQDGATPSSGVRSVSGRAAWIIALCGFPGGFLSAMLGISGGIVTNPLQQVLARIPIKNAIANTLAKASVTVPIACLMIMIMGVQAGHFDFWTPMLVALCLIPGSLVGSQLGPALTQRMSPVMVHAVFGVVALFMGINMLFFSN